MRFNMCLLTFQNVCGEYKHIISLTFDSVISKIKQCDGVMMPNIIHEKWLIVSFISSRCYQLTYPKIFCQISSIKISLRLKSKNLRYFIYNLDVNFLLIISFSIDFTAPLCIYIYVYTYTYLSIINLKKCKYINNILKCRIIIF